MRQQAMKFTCAILLLTAFAVPATAAQTSWAAFWAKFKTAVAKGDKKTVLSLSDEIDALPADYNALFGTKARKQCFAKAKPARETDGTYTVFCGEQGYTFGKVGNGQYKFTGTFAND